jgi:hypothetical protein
MTPEEKDEVARIEARLRQLKPLPKDPFSADEAMRRLAYVVAAGGFIVLLFGLTAESNVVSVISVGLMTACAAVLAAILLGFLFGVPYTKDSVLGNSELDERDEDTHNAEPNQRRLQSRAFNYRPNTSLEQISDWLTKMIVGVGLVEIKIIPGKLRHLAEYISRGLGGSIQAEIFAFAILLFFSVCGFLFGFLWARIYLRRWYITADEELAKKLEATILKASKLELNAAALALASQVLNPGRDDAPVPGGKINEAINAASSATRALIFDQAERTLDDDEADDYGIRIQGAVTIFKALILNDTKHLYHRNHGELSLALSRQRPPDIAAAERAITEAIRLRDLQHIKGWKYYEFRRGQYRISQDANFQDNRVSDKTSADQILRDLEIAKTDAERWNRWYGDNDVQKWIKLNNLESRLAPSPP